MLVIPAIDLAGGRVVRLRQGRFDAKTVFSDDPLGVARRFEEEGAAVLHVVDLDGARDGQPRQLPLVGEMAAHVRCRIHYGGGLRTIQQVDHALDRGVAKVVLGSAILSDPRTGHELAQVYPDHIIAALDVRDGAVRLRGWEESSGLTPTSAAELVAALGLYQALVTDIARDGMMAGPNVDLCEQVRRAGIKDVIVSGGVASLPDVVLCRDLGYAGVILGMALYTGAIELGQALAASRDTQGVNIDEL